MKMGKPTSDSTRRAETGSLEAGLPHEEGDANAPVLSPGQTETNLLGVYDAILEEHLPPSLLVDENRSLVHWFGGASRYLRIHDGRLSTDLLDMVDTDLRTALSGALPRACKDAAPSVYKGLRLRLGDGERLVNLMVKPIRDRRTGQPYALVSIQELAEAAAPEATETDSRQASDEQLQTLETEPAARPSMGIRVLIVEDNADSRNILKALLELDGFVVTAVEDGIQALEAIRRECPDVAFIDIGLPGLDGYGVARRVRAEKENKGIRLVALTGYGRPEDRQRVLEAGFDAHLVKPIRIEALYPFLERRLP